MRRLACGLAWLVVFAFPSAGAAAQSPAATTGAVKSVTATSATLNGTVNPEGQSTTYYFEYGATTAYGSTTVVSGAGSGTSNSSVSATITSLVPNTTYHYRLVATNASGPTDGADASFKTLPVPPSVSTASAESVSTSSATLTGAVNPEGQSTTYHFQYGTTTAYGSKTADSDAGTGMQAESVTASVGSLAAGTTYHFRVVATSGSGTSLGSDRSFTTAKAPRQPAASTGGAKSVTATSATLTGSVNPEGQATSYYFQYGTSTAYGGATATTAAGSGTASAAVSASLTSLSSYTVYHYRLVATNATGTTTGSDHTFRTAKQLSVAITADPYTIVFGESTTIAGVVSGSGAARATVTLQSAAAIGGPYATVRSTTASSTGTYAFPGLLPQSNTYFRVVAPSRISGPVLVLVRSQISLGVSRRHPPAGQLIRFAGGVQPGRAGVVVFLQRLGLDRRWHTVGHVRTRRLAGVYGYRLRLPARSGLYRAMIWPTAQNARGFSHIVRVRTQA